MSSISETRTATNSAKGGNANNSDMNPLFLSLSPELLHLLACILQVSGRLPAAFVLREAEPFNVVLLDLIVHSNV